jgi:O-6-methylguanine DNA methyltransferase
MRYAAVGDLWVAYRDGVPALLTGGGEADFQGRARMALGVAPEREDPAPEELGERIRRAAAGEDDDGPVDLSWLTPFRRRVIEIVRTIPRGQIRSYGWVAREAGSPRAMRAVGSTLAQNPLGPLVPCHRVRRADGGVEPWPGADSRVAAEGIDVELLGWLTRRGMRYCGNRADRTFCLPACGRWRAPGARPIYFHSAAEARAAGYAPCPHCRP